MIIRRSSATHLVVTGAVCAVTAAAILAFWAISAKAYTTEGGCYWPSIKNNSIFGWTDADSGAGYTAFANGASAWDATPTKVRLNIGAGSGITAESANFGNTGYDGITSIQCNKTTLVFSSADSFLNSYYTAGYSAGERQSVATHELGHSLGLDHNNNNICVLMYPTSARWTTCGIDTPQSDDINGINSIYGAP